MARRYVLADRDGTIIRDRHYLADPEHVELLPGVSEGLSALQRLGVGVVIVTNQSGIGRGFLDRARLAAIHDRLIALLATLGQRFDGIYYCPHRPEDACVCRKPGDGLVRQAMQDLDFNAADGWVVGDRECDIQLGKRVGAGTILVRSGRGRATEARSRVRPDWVAEDFSELATIIARELSVLEPVACRPAWTTAVS